MSWDPSMLAKPGTIRATGLSVRAYNAICKLRPDISEMPVEELANWSEYDLLRVGGVGKKVRSEIRALLAQHGLSFSETDHEPSPYAEPAIVGLTRQISLYISDELHKAIKVEKAVRDKTLQQLVTDALEHYFRTVP